tara:strand:+ start:1194 stop:1346 length:153 start_codon:yes stop_codon:yes gene_type:complete
MNSRTFEIRQAELSRDVDNHPHKDELIDIMYNQIQDDQEIFAQVKIPSKI